MTTPTPPPAPPTPEAVAALVAALEAVHAAATPGEWRAGTLNVWKANSSRFIAGCDSQRGMDYATRRDEVLVEDDANVRAIATTHNAVPAILAVLRAYPALVAVATYAVSVLAAFREAHNPNYPETPYMAERLIRAGEQLSAALAALDGTGT